MRGQIAVDGAARPFGLVKLANVMVLAAALQTSVAGVLVLLQGDLAWADVAVIGVALAAFAFAAVIAFRNLSVVEAVRQPFTLLSLFGAMLVSFGLAAAVASGIDWASFDPENPEAMATISGAMLYAFVGLAAFGGIVATLLARMGRIKGLNLSTRRLVTELDAHAEAQGDRVRAPPKHPVRGWALIGAGLAWFAGLQMVPNEIYFSETWFRAFSQASPLGFALFILARQAFQPDADALLAKDKRAPILFLRSFQDDERLAYNAGESALIDYSLETRLAEHFSRLGPFVAIGNPKEKSPELGAARAHLSDEEWQGRVTDWMDRSQLIVLMLGVTHWVGWELKTCFERGHAGKLLLLFPQSRKWFSFRKESAARLQTAVEALAGTPWAPALSALEKPHRLRALVLNPDGSVQPIWAGARSRTAYHLAALVGHRFILQRREGASA